MALDEGRGTASLREGFVTNRAVRRAFTVMPALALALLVAAIALGGSALQVAGGLAYGFFLSTLVDYLLHRFWFHKGPHAPRVEAMTMRMAKLHLDHHDIPASPKGAVNKVDATSTIILVLTVISLLLPGPNGFWLAACAGGATGALLLDLIHYGTHQLPMKAPILRFYKRHHMLHHYRDATVNYATLFPPWDMVFGTYWDGRERPDRGDRSQRATAD